MRGSSGAAIWAGLAALAHSQTFQAGVAQADLEPALGMPMSGYGARTGVANGVLDPVQARALALSDGNRTIALVTLDLVFSIELPEMNRIRAAVRPRGVDEVIFHASHTHSGPTYSANREAYGRAVAGIQQTIVSAAAAKAPVKIGTAWGVSYLGHNRRRIALDGDPQMFWRDETKVSTFPVDPTVGVIRIDRIDGTPLAILVNYACHPVVLGPDNLKYSADYPSVMRAVIEEGMGGTPMAFFLQGAPGDINPYYDKTTLQEDAIARMQETGRKLGQEALRIARSIQPQTPSSPHLQSKTVVLPVVSRWDIPKLKGIVKERYKLDDSRAARLVREKMDLPVTTLLIGNELAFVTMPGEPFVEFQMQLRARSPLPNTYFLGYTNGAFGYFPTIAAAARGGYGANSTATQVEVGAGERMLNAGLISLYELMGKLSGKPAQGEW
jgi:hypothetical protein